MDGYVGNVVRGRKSIFVCFVECGCGSWDFLFCQVLIVSSLSRWVSPGALLSLYNYIAHSFNTGLLSLAKKVLMRKYPDHKRWPVV